MRPLRVGTAVAQLLDTPHQRPESRFASSRLGDYVLSNSVIMLVFSAVDRDQAPMVGSSSLVTRTHHSPGALLDVKVGRIRVDFLSEFTQSIGMDLDQPLIQYDEAEFVERGRIPNPSFTAPQDRELPAAVGLRLSGPLPGNDRARVRTTYWLAPDDTRVQIESEVLGASAPVAIVDVADWGAGNVLLDAYGVAPGGTGFIRDVSWYAARGGDMVVGSAAFGGKLNGFFAGRYSRVEAFVESDGQRRPLRSRWLFFGIGKYSAVTDQILRQAGPALPQGTLRGRAVLDTDQDKVVPDSWVSVYSYDREIGLESRELYTQIGTDSSGSFEALLPVGRYFLASGSRSRRQGLSGRGIVVEKDKVVERDVALGEPGTLTLTFVDSRTKEPLAARVKFEAIPPTPPLMFQTIDSPRGYLDHFYVPPQGRTIEMYEGQYALFISRGIRYDMVEQSVEITWGADTVWNIELPETNPTPGWTGVLFGAMTRATPNCSLNADDAVIMATGEGFDWIISGDWEILTDLAPSIEKLDLKGKLGSSRGFRTWLPARPDWGTFFIYPVAPDAPDPRAVREQWYQKTTASEFLGVLRRLYPGALIESVDAYNENSGYLWMADKNSSQVAINPPPDADTSIDAINLFPSHVAWDFRSQKNFFFTHTLNHRRYIPAPVSSTFFPLSSEPGYPRLLVRTGADDMSALPEADLFSAMKAGRWQVTSGPFIEFTVNGKGEAEFVQGLGPLAGKLKLTAPNWVDTGTIDFCKEGVMSWRQSYSYDSVGAVRLERSFAIPLYSHNKGDKDTELSIMIMGAPPKNAGGPRMTLALSAPIYADANGDNKWDPPRFGDKGQ